MLALSASCATIALFVVLAKALPTRRRMTLLGVVLSAMFLLFFDRLAYIYSGDGTITGYVMVRLSNFLVYFLTIVVVYAINHYVADLLQNEGGLAELPVRVRIVDILCVVGVLLLAFSQFSGLYYFFDKYNRYHRGPGFMLCYVVPLIAPIVVLSVVFQHRKRLSKAVVYSVFAFIIAPMAASIVQVFAYGLSLTNIAFVLAAEIVYIVAIYDLNRKLESANRSEIEFLQQERQDMNRLFEQTTTAFVNAIDEKNEYTKGHSARVAKYAMAIAQGCGKSERECRQVYYGALLHDVGKMEIPDVIIEKVDDLTEEEEEILRQKPVIGDSILSNITDYPYLRDAARYACERYDGSGYPEHLKGDEIPEIARIIAVAVEYDNMTTGRADRDPFPQIIVREELMKMAGTTLDPRFATMMVTLVDEDRDYLMRQDSIYYAGVIETGISCDTYRSAFTKGILVEDTISVITFKAEEMKESDSGFCAPSVIVFDSYDGRIHDDRKTIDAFRYIEYAELWFDGNTVSTGARDMKSETRDIEDGLAAFSDTENTSGSTYEITVGRFEDHVKIIMTGAGKIVETVIALPDSSKYAYVSITGEHCNISDIKTDRTDKRVLENDIARIVPPVSYIDRMVGDVPNIQVNRTRSVSTDGVPVRDGMRIVFHGMSLPSAHLVWHCPYIVLFSSQNGKVGGPGYKEYALIKMNGENECTDVFATNSAQIDRTVDFKNWDEWKKINKEGLDIEVNISVGKDTIKVETSDAGINIVNTTKIKESVDTVYVAITGDQCAVTDIRIR